MVLPQRLSGEAIALIVKERARLIGDEMLGYSGHSLRAGFALWDVTLCVPPAQRSTLY
jgi:hypothetical protein